MHNLKKMERDEKLLAGSKWEELRMLKDILLTLITSFSLLINKVILLFSPTHLKDIKGQLALVSGGSKGFGREVCLELAKKGCNIAVVARDLSFAEKFAEELKNLGVKAKAFKADVSKSGDITRLKEEIEHHLGSVDILINNAGLYFEKEITEETSENQSYMMNLNIMSSVWTTKTFLNGMIERKRGHIVGICSFAGLMGIPTGICYTASKFGLRGFMEGLTLDLHHRNLSEYIKTTCYFPHFMDTGPRVRTAITDGCNHKVIFDPKIGATHVVNGILKNDEIVMFPWYLYYAAYVL